MQVPTALVVECLTVLQRFCFCSFFLLLPVNEQVARKAARRERQRGRAATSAAASRMFTDQSQRCLAQGAAFCRKCTFQVHDRFCNFARYKDTDSDPGQTKQLRSCEPQLGRQKFRLHTPAAQSYSHASRPLYFQALVLHRTAAHIQYVTVCLTYVQWFRAFSSRRYLDETSTRPKVPKTSPKPGDRGPLDDLSCCRVSLEC